MIPCRFYRFWLSLFLEEEHARPRWLSRHLERCPACHESVCRQLALTQHLREGARACWQAPPPFLQARVVSRLRHSTPSATNSQAPWRHWKLALGVTSLIAGALLFVRHADLRLVSPTPAPTLSASLAPLDSLAQQVRHQVQLTQLSQALDGGLETETQHLVNDGRNALQLLAQNFLPTPPAKYGVRSDARPR